MRFHNRGDGLAKKNLRPFDRPILAIGCFQRDEGPLVNPGQFQRLQPEGERLAPEFQRGLQARAWPLRQMFFQGRRISLRQAVQLTLHDVCRLHAQPGAQRCLLFRHPGV